MGYNKKQRKQIIDELLTHTHINLQKLINRVDNNEIILGYTFKLAHFMPLFLNDTFWEFYECGSCEPFIRIPYLGEVITSLRRGTEIKYMDIKIHELREELKTLNRLAYIEVKNFKLFNNSEVK